jgi:hypothetical protein
MVSKKWYNTHVLLLIASLFYAHLIESKQSPVAMERRPELFIETTQDGQENGFYYNSGLIQSSKVLKDAIKNYNPCSGNCPTIKVNLTMEELNYLNRILSNPPKTLLYTLQAFTHISLEQFTNMINAADSLEMDKGAAVVLRYHVIDFFPTVAAYNTWRKKNGGTFLNSVDAFIKAEIKVREKQGKVKTKQKKQKK